MYCLLHGECDLLGESLLHLQPATKCLGYPCEFGKPEDKLVGNVGDGNLHIVRKLLQVRDRAEERFQGSMRTLPVNGTRWCSQRLDISISRTRTISS